MKQRLPIERGNLAGEDKGVDVGELKRALVEFVRHASTEISTLDEKLLPRLAGLLPTGTTVYVAHTPRASVEDVVRVAGKVQSMGFRASPHIVARRVPGEQILKAALRSLREQGVEQILLVAGDVDQPLGPFNSTLQLLDSGAIEGAALKRVGVAGHPEGHRAASEAELLSALLHKQEFGRRTGIEVHIVTQFGFDPDRICAWDRGLTAEGISLPVHVGIAGPAPLAKLLKFAIQCGVGTSMQSFVRNVSSMASLAGHVMGAEEMLVGLVRSRLAHPASRLVQPHFYAFGGTLATARWLCAVLNGKFETEREDARLVVET